MNLLWLVADTLRWDYLGAYGNAWIQTPNLDRLAREGVVFEEAFAEGLPTLPARRVMQTGRPIVPFRYVPQPDDMVQLAGWHPLFDEDIAAAEWLRQHGFYTALVTDVYHMMKPGKNYHRGFDHWHWVRGQEDDRWALRDSRRVAALLDRAAPQARTEFRRRHWLTQHLVNRQAWRTQADTSVAAVMAHAARFIREYTLDDPFYLWVDCFDPHEPWDPPLEYARLYDADFDSLDGLVPPGLTAEMSASQVRNTLTAYAGEVTLVDTWVGHLLQALQESGRMADTLVLFTSDHGCMLGEQGEMHKGESRLRNQCTRLPLIIRHPQGIGAGQRVKGFVQHVDMLPTALAIMGLPRHERMLGHDVWPLVQAQASSPRDYVVTAFGNYASYRTARWNYIAPWTETRRGAPVEQLFDLANDPQELTDVKADYPEVVAELRAALEAHLREMAPHTAGHLGGTAETDALGAMGVPMSFDALPSLRSPQ